MNIHKTHIVLGRYCWDCKTKALIGVPGWTRPLKGPYTHYSPWDRNSVTGAGYTTSIVWANGDNEIRHHMYEVCTLCNKHCKYPVYGDTSNTGDRYKEIRKAML
jgi:hypothetical protein